MLVLSSLHSVLSEVLAPPALHTAVLFTPAGAPVSVATAPGRSRDDVRVMLALASEIWAQTRAKGEGAAESEVGRVVVLPVGVDDPAEQEPMLLLALQGTDVVDWQEMRGKAQAVADHLSPTIAPLRVKLLTRTSSKTKKP